MALCVKLNEKQKTWAYNELLESWKAYKTITMFLLALLVIVTFAYCYTTVENTKNALVGNDPHCRFLFDNYPYDFQEECK